MSESSEPVHLLTIALCRGSAIRVTSSMLGVDRAYSGIWPRRLVREGGRPSIDGRPWDTVREDGTNGLN